MKLRDLRRRAVDAVLEGTVALAYGKPGWLVRRRRFGDGPPGDMRGKVAIVTGATRGIGLAAAKGLARCGATVVLGCRDKMGRGEAARAEVQRAVSRAEVEVLELDVSSLDSVRQFARQVAVGFPAVHALVHNAGVLEKARRLSVDGVELTFATNVLGGFALTRALRRHLEAGRGRIVNVTSGGMYARRLEVGDPMWERRAFDGVKAYAETKRAQVVLSEQWGEHLAATGITSNAMHPGWVDTPGVAEALPRFRRVMKPLLRDGEGGADTIVWLAASDEVRGVTGQLFFDREPRRTHVLPWTRATADERQALWELCERLARYGAPWET